MLRDYEHLLEWSDIEEFIGAVLQVGRDALGRYNHRGAIVRKGNIAAELLRLFERLNIRPWPGNIGGMFNKHAFYKYFYDHRGPASRGLYEWRFK